ncbi:hypothetical protein Tco_1272231 [Tanacetum coccineum]
MKKSDNDKNSIGCVAMYGSLELQPDVQQMVDSMVKRLNSLSRKSDRQFVVVDLRLDMLDKRGCQDINNGYVSPLPLATTTAFLLVYRSVSGECAALRNVWLWLSQ